ncbi:MAG: hypothetical protein M3Q64_00460 [bacterium]|nr:hypothetical protein [bacterium]
MVNLGKEIEYSLTNLMDNLKIVERSEPLRVISNILGYVHSQADKASDCPSNDKVVYGTYLFVIQEILDREPLKLILPSIAQYHPQYIVQMCAKALLAEQIGMYKYSPEVSIITQSNLLIHSDKVRAQRLRKSFATDPLLTYYFSQWEALAPQLELLHSEEYV